LCFNCSTTKSNNFDKALKLCEAVCERIRQRLAQLKNVNSLKLCVLGFWRVLMTIGILILAIGSTLAPDDVTSKTFFLFYFGPCLPPEGGERACEIERAQFGILVTFRFHLSYLHNRTALPDVIAIKICPMSRNIEKLALPGTEIEEKNRFRRDVVWSQRGAYGQNKYTYRHQHPPEPQNAKFQRVHIFYPCHAHSDLSDSFANGLIGND
ncbi:hypothetical protein PRIPAC_88693, partial [Pristionchus pacificus]|uniref:Uncharacterized protein n=1 Tax=Pristionchus pacificus TaxID=54126 RepID=A0A2A6CYP7_PRIPA